jgi:hypothetical protein
MISEWHMIVRACAGYTTSLVGDWMSILSVVNKVALRVRPSGSYDSTAAICTPSTTPVAVPLGENITQRHRPPESVISSPGPPWLLDIYTDRASMFTGESSTISEPDRKRMLTTSPVISTSGTGRPLAVSERSAIEKGHGSVVASASSVCAWLSMISAVLWMLSLTGTSGPHGYSVSISTIPVGRSSRIPNRIASMCTLGVTISPILLASPSASSCIIHSC